MATKNRRPARTRQLMFGTDTGTPSYAPSGSPAGSAVAGEPVTDPASNRPRLGGGKTQPVGRESVDSSLQFLGRFPVILPPNSPDEAWRILKLDTDALERMGPSRLMELLIDLSPDMSRAVWDWLRMCNPGWTMEAYKPGTTDRDDDCQAVLDTFVDRLNDRYGSFDVVLGRYFVAAFLRGAFFAELVFGADGQTAVDLAAPDPATARFRRQVDPVLGQTWQLGQWQIARFVPLDDRPTIRYLAIDPVPGNPYGRPLAAPALFSTLFLIGMLHDLRRVVGQQGYPRMDVEVKLKELADASPPAVGADPKAWQQWVDATIQEVITAYSGLAPDDAYIHTDVVQVNAPKGAATTGNMGGFTALIEALERMAMRALKSMPLLMGMADGTSEANANRQWEIHAAGIKAIQHYLETLLSRLLELALRAQGLQATVDFTFSELRAAEMLRDEQTKALQTQNATNAYLMGWIDQDEAANSVWGHDADQPEPRETSTMQQPVPLPYPGNPEPAPIPANPAMAATGAQNPVPPAQVNAEPGGDRATATNGHVRWP